MKNPNELTDEEKILKALKDFPNKRISNLVGICGIGHDKLRYHLLPLLISEGKIKCIHDVYSLNTKVEENGRGNTNLPDPILKKEEDKE